MPLQLFGDFQSTGGSGTTADTYQDSQVCINWYPETAIAKSAKVADALLGCPGLIALASASGGALPTLGTSWATPSATTNLPVRGFWVLPGAKQALCVVSSTCYLVTYSQASLSALPTINMNKVGVLSTSFGTVDIRDNNIGGYAILVDGPFYYLYNISTQVFSQGSDPAWLGANRVAFIDGWWIFNRPGTQEFYTNYPVYGTGFNGSYYALKDSASDNLVGVLESKEELWLPGERTTEIWYNAGGANFPFQRLVGTMLQVGCKAPYSIARLSGDGDDGMIWLGRSERGENIVIRTKGFNYEVVSTRGVSDAIATYTYTADAIGFTYQEDGHEFYMLTFPTADATWVYDASAPPDMAWHQRLSWDPYSQQWHRHRANVIGNFAGMRIVGDYQNGVLYQYTRHAYSDAAWPLRSIRRTPHVWSRESRQRVFMSSLQVDFAPGVGNATGNGVNPNANLRISRDGGTTFGQTWQAPIGAQGQTFNRTLWRRLAMARDCVFELEVIDPVRRDLVGSTLRAIGEETSGT